MIAVLENPTDVKNIGTVIRNVNALVVEKANIGGPRKSLPDGWQEMREKRSLSKISASVIKWSFVKRFDSAEDCLEHLVEKIDLFLWTPHHTLRVRIKSYSMNVILQLMES